MVPSPLPYSGPIVATGMDLKCVPESMYPIVAEFHSQLQSARTRICRRLEEEQGDIKRTIRDSKPQGAIAVPVSFKQEMIDDSDAVVLSVSDEMEKVNLSESDTASVYSLLETNGSDSASEASMTESCETLTRILVGYNAETPAENQDIERMTQLLEKISAMIISLGGPDQWTLEDFEYCDGCSEKDEDIADLKHRYTQLLDQRGLLQVKADQVDSVQRSASLELDEIRLRHRRIERETEEKYEAELKIMEQVQQRISEMFKESQLERDEAMDAEQILRKQLELAAKELEDARKQNRETSQKLAASEAQVKFTTENALKYQTTLGDSISQVMKERDAHKKALESMTAQRDEAARQAESVRETYKNIMEPKRKEREDMQKKIQEVEKQLSDARMTVASLAKDRDDAIAARESAHKSLSKVCHTARAERDDYYADYDVYQKTITELERKVGVYEVMESRMYAAEQAAKRWEAKAMNIADKLKGFIKTQDKLGQAEVEKAQRLENERDELSLQLLETTTRLAEVKVECQKLKDKLDYPFGKPLKAGGGLPGRWPA
ncbi:Hypothetical protein D9617_4g001040 [Elsinoe fawcettii]|nr:Hypothetical protein D9617_4g001040 [Elsinoe fawcettii]